jgi:hypothetical protein
VDHAWAKSIYFRDPNGLSLEYCCLTRNLTEDDATMQDRFTIGRAALELDNRFSAEITAVRSDPGKGKRWSSPQLRGQNPRHIASGANGLRPLHGIDSGMRFQQPKARARDAGDKSRGLVPRHPSATT